MTQVFIHPAIEDYFVEYDFGEAANSLAGRQRIVDDYHSEKLILLRNLRFDADLAFLQSVAFYQKWKWKKLALSSFELIPPASRREVPEIREFVQDVFAGDWGRFDYFIEQSKVVNHQLRSALATIFVNYGFSRQDIIWRFTETRVENLHFDVDRNCDNLELIRLYANFDDIPRIWYTAGTFTSTAHEWYTKLNLSRFLGQPHDKLLKELSTRVFGDWHARGRDTAPRHLVLFEPGDVWLTDGRMVSHQVIYGRRVVSTLFVAPTEGVPNPKATFAQKVADLHKREEGIKNGSDNDATSGPAKQVSEQHRKPLDLSVSWEGLPDHIRKATLVRL